MPLKSFTFIFVFASVFIVTGAGVEIFRRWSLRRKVLDVPNERSLHTQPTPRGGGAVIVAVSLICYSFYGFFEPRGFFWNYFAGAVAVAFVSWLDDLYSISFVWRFVIHAAAAALAAYGLYEPAIWETLPQGEFLRLSIVFLSFLWIVWLTNAYNFMDGIDGLAGIQAIAAGLCWLIAGWILNADAAGFYGGVLAFSSFGFLIHNWHPARIFMGDVGSAFLGYGFAVLPILAARESPGKIGYPLWIFFGAGVVWYFVFDTVLTLTARIKRREKIWTAHRGHIYQKLVGGGLSHGLTAALYGILSVLTGASLIAALVDSRLISMVFIGAGFGSIFLLVFSKRSKSFEQTKL